MPTYIVKTSNLRINKKKKNILAKVITEPHKKQLVRIFILLRLFFKKIIRIIILWVAKLLKVNKFLYMEKYVLEGAIK